MRVLVTGSAGHLGEALMRALESTEHQAVGLDIEASPATHLVGSIVERDFVKRSMQNIDAVLHTATLHKPHIATHTRQQFIDTNITGTLNLLEEAAAAGVGSFVFTSTTSTFGHALRPAPTAPAAWITEDVVPVPRNVYGVTKVAAENLCEVLQRQTGMPCIILRTSRFFPEEDDERSARQAFDDANLKVNEFLYRRGDVEDMVSAHLHAMLRGPEIGFGRYIVSATTPFSREDLQELRTDAPSVVRRYIPQYAQTYRQLGWSMLPAIDRVYVNDLARKELRWQPRHDFGSILQRLAAGEDFRSPLARAIGSKGYHAQQFADGPYPVDRP